MHKATAPGDTDRAYYRAMVEEHNGFQETLYVHGIRMPFTRYEWMEDQCRESPWIFPTVAVACNGCGWGTFDHDEWEDRVVFHADRCPQIGDSDATEEQT